MSDSKKVQVAIFGAGIAGLTAAHELIERGFDVEVYEQVRPSVPDRLRGVECAVGGVARTQWGRVERDLQTPWPVSTTPLWLCLDEPEEPGGDEPRYRILFDGAYYVDPDSATKTLVAVAALLDEARATVRRVEVRGYRDNRPLDPTSHAPIDVTRARLVAAELAKLGVTQTLEPVGLGVGYPYDWTKTDGARNYVSFHIVEDWIPGEHGFRFFPSFYRNLFDTMRRTPVPDENEPVYQETPRTVLDNVVPTEYMGLGTTRTRQPFPFRRRPPTSLQELFDQLIGMLQAMGHSLTDLNRFHVKLFKYMTSCQARRGDYERLSWWDFLEADQFSEPFQLYLDRGAETLLGMRARVCDARTYGSVSVQMIQNQLGGLAHTDGTLNGPTSLVWFDHWRRYLETQGVRFRRGRLCRFEVFDEHTVWPVVQIHQSPWASGETTPGTDAEDEAEDVKTVLVRDYYVVALGADEVQQLVIDSPGLHGGDFDRIRDFPLGDPTQAHSGGALEHMSGIQFYFRRDFQFIDGHVIFPDTDWRLSAIFQPQFWTEKRGWWSGYRGVLSVDVCNWHSPSNPAWDLNRDAIADQVWQQIRNSLEPKDPPSQGRPARVWPAQGAIGVTPGSVAAGGTAPPKAPSCLPQPLFYHLDGNIVFGRGPMGDLPRLNRTPYLLSRADEYKYRPGRPGDYVVRYGSLVLAGVLMQTYTRLTTMEAANESARHAVNAILREEQCPDYELCAVFNPEDDEPADLRFLVEVDAKLHAHGLPHLVDILSLEAVPPVLLRPDPDLTTLGLGRFAPST